MIDLTGKGALVTGGSTESGQAIAKALARAGAAVAICGPQVDALNAVVDEIRQQDGHAIAVPADIRQPEQVDHALEVTLIELGRLDVLIILSGVWGGGYIHEHRLDTWDRVIEANLRAPFLLLKAVMPYFRKVGHGQIMILSSDSSFTAYPMDGVYGVSLHALLALVELAQLENVDQGIRVDLLASDIVTSPTGTPADEASLLPGDLAAWVLWLIDQPPGSPWQPVRIGKQKLPPA